MTYFSWNILFAVLGYGLLHSLLASVKAKELARLWFGPQANRWFRLAYNVIAVVTFLPILMLMVLRVDHVLYRIHFPWFILSIILQIAAGLIAIADLKQSGIATFLGITQFLLPADKQPHRLVTGGLYRYVRHPLYSAGLIFIWLMPIMTWNLLSLNIGLTLYLIGGALVEERKLLREYGDTYAEYCKRTPMLIPRIHLSPGKR